MRKWRALLLGSVMLVVGGAGASAVAGCAAGELPATAAAPAEAVQVIIPPQEPPPASASAAAEEAPAEDAGKLVYKLSKVADATPYLRLKRVTLEANSTRLDFNYKNTDATGSWIMVSAAGSEHAFFLQTPDGKKVAFRRASGIKVKPEQTEVAPGRSVSFSLFFDALDPGVRTFDIYEGEDAKDPTTNRDAHLWSWRGVTLQ